MQHSKFGTEILAAFYGIGDRVLKNDNLLNSIFRKSLESSKFKIIECHSHKFLTDGEGVTGIFLLSESHATYHTYPEWRSMVINIFSCGESNPLTTMELLVKELIPTSFNKCIVKRYFNIYGY